MFRVRVDGDTVTIDCVEFGKVWVALVLESGWKRAVSSEFEEKWIYVWTDWRGCRI